MFCPTAHQSKRYCGANPVMYAKLFLKVLVKGIVCDKVSAWKRLSRENLILPPRNLLVINLYRRRFHDQKYAF